MLFTMLFDRLHIALLTFGTLCAALAPDGDWNKFNIAPASKTLWPTAVKQTNGTVLSASNLIGNKSTTAFATLSGGSWVALDFGKEVIASPTHLTGSYRM